jgi:hypothetical protein
MVEEAAEDEVEVDLDMEDVVGEDVVGVDVDGEDMVGEGVDGEVEDIMAITIIMVAEPLYMFIVMKMTIFVLIDTIAYFIRS